MTPRKMVEWLEDVMACPGPTYINHHKALKEIRNFIASKLPYQPGGCNGKCILHPQDIPVIRGMCKNMANPEISVLYGVSPRTISDVRHFKTWKDV